MMIDVCCTVEDIVESFARIASAKGIALTVKLGDDSLPARFDHQRIQQVLGKRRGVRGARAVRLTRIGAPREAST